MYRTRIQVTGGLTLLFLAMLWPGQHAVGQQMAAHEAARADVLSRQLEGLVASIHGDWGNMDQFFFQQRLGVDPESRRGLVHVSIAPVAHDALASEATDLTQLSMLRVSSGDQATRMLDERILEHMLDPDNGDMVSRVHSTAGALQDCQILWHLDASQYTGRQSGSQCPNWGEGDQAGISSLALSLSQDHLWIARDREPGLSVGQRYVHELRFRRAHMFTCRINVILADGGQMDFGQLRVQRFDTWTDLRVHDQGGEVWIDTKDTPSRRLGLRLHHVVWPFGDSTPSRGLFLLNAELPDDGRGVAYASSSPDSVRLALSNRDVSASCFMDTP